jgi:hypothetical protein
MHSRNGNDVNDTRIGIGLQKILVKVVLVADQQSFCQALFFLTPDGILNTIDNPSPAIVNESTKDVLML